MNEIEILQSFYSSETMVAKNKLFRFNKGGLRYYCDENSNPKIRITSLLSAIIPMPKFFDNWRHEIGKEEAYKIS